MPTTRWHTARYRAAPLYLPPYAALRTWARHLPTSPRHLPGWAGDTTTNAPYLHPFAAFLTAVTHTALTHLLAFWRQLWRAAAGACALTPRVLPLRVIVAFGADCRIQTSSLRRCSPAPDAVERRGRDAADRTYLTLFVPSSAAYTWNAFRDAINDKGVLHHTTGYRTGTTLRILSSPHTSFFCLHHLRPTA